MDNHHDLKRRINYFQIKKMHNLEITETDDSKF